MHAKSNSFPISPAVEITQSLRRTRWSSSRSFRKIFIIWWL